MLICLMIMLVLVTMYPARVVVFIFIGLAAIFTIKYPVMGLVGWIMGYPYFNIFTQATGIVGYLALSPLVFISFIMLAFKKKKISMNIKFIFYCCIMITNGLFSLLLARNPVQNYLSLGMLLMGFFIIITIFNIVKENQTSFYILNQAYILAVVSIFISNLLTGNLFGVGRLSIGNSIRRVANIASPSVIILFLELLIRTSKKSKSIINYKLPFWAIVFLFTLSSLVLLSTVSRGAYIAVALTSILMFIFNSIYTKDRTNPVKKVPMYIIGFSLIMWSLKFVENNIAGRYLARARISNFSGNLRWRIWEAAISQMKSHEYIIGAGPNIFRKLAILGGYDYYAHSVFVDTFVTLGTIGILSLLMIIINVFSLAIRRKNPYTFSMIILLVFLYVTHGNLTGSLDFWTLLGMAYASLNIKQLSYSK